ncbi:MAG: hypothetical protein ACM359_13415 [Bacillota bacterium]
MAENRSDEPSEPGDGDRFNYWVGIIVLLMILLGILAALCILLW